MPYPSHGVLGTASIYIYIYVCVCVCVHIEKEGVDFRLKGFGTG